MRNRNNKIEFWASDDELDLLVKNAQACKMSKSAYMRRLLNGYEPMAAPPYDYHETMQLLRMAGNNMNQVAHRAHVTGDVNADVYSANASRIIEAADELSGVFLPRKVR